ncbi:MAG: type II secretion system protein N [Aquimonas sp.]|nr:type II secretion system protein N [Aquimonas sp.]
MKFLIRLVIFLLLLVLVLGVVALFLPASMAVGLMEGRMGALRLEQVGGTVWNGRAERVVLRDRELGRLAWSIKPLALFSRRLDADLRLQGPELSADGFVSSTGPGNLVMRGMRIGLDAQRMQPALDVPALQLRGRVELDLDTVEVRQFFPARIDGRAIWRDAAVTGEADARLGELRAEFLTQPDGSIAGTVIDNGGPLQVEDGRFSLGVRGYSAEATLRARDGDAAVQRALQHIGVLQEDGSSRFELQGRLLPVRG